jgi:ribonuclease HI
MIGTSSTPDNPVIIYTDGACKGNPGPGGWGVVMSRNGKSLELYGGEFYTTNNAMELTAAIKALEALKRPLPVRLVTDSAYVVDGMVKYREGWKAQGWCKSRGQPVANAELWRRLDALASVHAVEWVWVRGHSGEAGNERADHLANLGVKKPLQ